MQKGLYREFRADLGEECARVEMAGDIELFVTRARYEAESLQPPFDDLPTDKAYRKKKR